MSLSVSIIICCYNSASRLPETLRHLALQKVSANLDWEIIVVDNASADDTAESAVHSCPYELRERLRVVSEPTPGLSSARIKGIKEARHNIVCFVDDDNWVNPNFVQNASEIFSRDSLIGLAGGPSEPVYETAPPEWLKMISGFYAIGEQQPHEGDITNNPGTLLWGAGMCARRQALLDLLGDRFAFQLSDRHGSSLETGGDTELCFTLRDRGWKLWYDRRLSIRHYVPEARMSWNYACRLLRGAGKASVHLDMYLIAHKRWPFDSRSPIKNSWSFQFLKTIKFLFILLVKNPIQCLSYSKKGLPALQFNAAIARFYIMLTLVGNYAHTIEKIRCAKSDAIK